MGRCSTHNCLGNHVWGWSDLLPLDIFCSYQMGDITENLVDKIVLFAVFRGDTSAIGKWSRSDNHTWQWHRPNTRANKQTNRYSAGHLDFSLPRQVWLRLRLPRPPSSWSPDRRWWPRAGSLSWRWRAPWSWHPHLPSVGALLTSVERLERVSYSLLTYMDSKEKLRASFQNNPELMTLIT